MPSTTWADLEAAVRAIATLKWRGRATPEIINGVKVDCVVKHAPDNWACVEITEEKSLDKLRTDLAKFATIRPFLFSQDIYCDCYFVTRDAPPPSLNRPGFPGDSDF